MVSKSEVAAQVENTSVCVCIVVGGRAADSRHVDALRIVGTKSEVAAQAEAQVCVCA